MVPLMTFNDTIYITITTLQMPEKSFSELKAVLTQYYHLLGSGGWVENEFDETKDID